MHKGIGLGAMLVSGFAIVSLAAVGIGAYGIASMGAIDAADRFLYEKATAPMAQLVAMTKSFQRQRIALRDSMDAPTAGAAAAAIAEGRAQGDSVAKAAAELEASVATGSGGELLASLKKAVQRYDAAFDAIGKAYGRGDKAAVASLMAGEGKAAAEAEQETIDAIVKTKIAYAKSVADSNEARGAATARWMISLLAAITAIGLGVAISITRRVTRSVGGEPAEIAAIADEVALGGLSMDLGDAEDSSGIRRSLAGMVASLKTKAEALKLVAEGDLTAEVELASERDEFGAALRDTVDSLGDILGQVSGSVEQVAAGASQVSSAAQSLSQGAAEQAASVEEISAALVEINGQTAQNSQNALQMNGLAKTALEKADGGNASMKELVAAMADINRSSEDVKKIVKAIDDIAFQINLLALNANVEAARAGKYGKGFAVVADEVRSLAVRSADAVKETTRMVEESIGKMEKGNELVHLTADKLEEIAGGSGKLAALADEVANACAEQSRGLEQISQGISQIDQVTQSTSSSAEESAAAAEELASQAGQLKDMVERFKLRQGERGADEDPLEGLDPELVKRIVAQLKGASAPRGTAVPGKGVGDKTAPRRKRREGLRTSGAAVKGEEADARDEDFREF